MRRTATALCCRRPVNSTLGVALNTGRTQLVTWHQQPLGASLAPGKLSVMAPAQPATTARSEGHEVAAMRRALPCKRVGKPYLKTPPLGVATHSDGQFHGRAALGGPGSLRHRRAGGAGSHHRRTSTASASAGLRYIDFIAHHRKAAACQQRRLTGRSRGRATARQPARAAHRPIMRRTGGLPCCCAPLNSALGLTNQTTLHVVQHPAIEPRDVACVCSPHRTAWRCLGRMLVHGVPPRRKRARPAPKGKEGVPRPRWNRSRIAGVRRRSLRRLVPVR